MSRSSIESGQVDLKLSTLARLPQVFEMSLEELLALPRQNS